MGVIDGKTFKSGNTVVLPLPEELGISADVAMKIEQNGTTLTVRPALDPVEEKRKVMKFVAELRALGPPIVPIEIRDPNIFPDRPGLY